MVQVKEAHLFSRNLGNPRKYTILLSARSQCSQMFFIYEEIDFFSICISNMQLNCTVIQ